MNTELKEIIGYIRSYVELEKASGFYDYFSKAAPKALAVAQANEAPELDLLKSRVLVCEECGLRRTRQNVVFGAGSSCARLMFVGEAPGEDEDIQGLPFVGRAGQLLTRIIESIGLKREDVYIANILKCRPPHNRAPLPAEILACVRNVRRQIELIKPKVICTLGKFASQTLLDTQVPITALRGKFREYNGIKVMPTFHPAYLLRNPNDKRLVWEDMKKIKKELSLD